MDPVKSVKNFKYQEFFFIAGAVAVGVTAASFLIIGVNSYALPKLKALTAPKAAPAVAAAPTA